jgi:hypothetical protein
MIFLSVKQISMERQHMGVLTLTITLRFYNRLIVFIGAGRYSRGYLLWVSQFAVRAGCGCTYGNGLVIKSVVVMSLFLGGGRGCLRRNCLYRLECLLLSSTLLFALLNAHVPCPVPISFSSPSRHERASRPNPQSQAGAPPPRRRHAPSHPQWYSPTASVHIRRRITEV